MQGKKYKNRCCVKIIILIFFSVEREDCVNAVLLFNKILEKYPLIKNVVIFLKYILRKKGKNDNYTGGLSSYLLLNLVYGWALKLNEDEISINFQNFNLEKFLKSFLEFFSDKNIWEKNIFKIQNEKFCTYEKNTFYSHHKIEKLLFEDSLNKGKFIGSNCNYEIISGIFKEILNKINDKEIINYSRLLSFIDLSPELLERAIYLKSYKKII
jgi:hypothetical protein